MSWSSNQYTASKVPIGYQHCASLVVGCPRYDDLSFNHVGRLDSVLKSRDITWPTKVGLVKAVFSSSHAQMWELDHKESWAPKNWCFWIVLEKTLESPLDSKESKPVNPKENQSWIFIQKDWCWSWSSSPLATWCEELTHWKRLDAGKDWRQEEKGMTEDAMVGWNHRLNGHECEQTLGDSVGQRSWRAAVYGVTDSEMT